MDIPLKKNDWKQKNFIEVLLSKHYKLQLQFYMNIKSPFVTV